MSSTDRDSSGAITEKCGFSVVAATRVTQPFSTAGSSASCWVLEKRWTSSTNSTVDRPLARPRLASSITARTWATPALTADTSTKERPDSSATRWASVVLPVPGGPHSSTDTGRATSSPPSTRRRSGDPGRTRWSCPTTSSRVAGRIRAARGAWARARSSPAEVNRSSGTRPP